MNAVFAWLVAKAGSVSPKTWLLIIVILLSTLFGMWLQCKLHRCPVVKVGTEMTLGVVTHSPAVKDTIPKKDIKTTIKQVISYQWKHDTVKRDSVVYIHDTTAVIAETQRCYSFRYEAPDHAVFVPRLCSREFKIQPPIDMIGDVDYTPRPDTLRTIYRVDTVSFPAKRFYIGIGAGGGYGIDATGRKGWNVNGGIQVGVALKQF